MQDTSVESDEMKNAVTRQPRPLSGLVPRFCADDCGQSLVEFALTLPALILVVAGIMVFGLAFDNYISLTEATAVAARQLAISRGQTLDPCQTVYNAVSGAAPMLTASKMTFTISLNGTNYNGTSCAGTSTSGAPTNMVLGSNTTVNVSYPYSMAAFRYITTSSFTLVAQSSELMQ